MTSPTNVSRRDLLKGGLAASVASAAGMLIPALPAGASATAGAGALAQLRALEARHHARLGVHARNKPHRGDHRLPHR